MIVVVVVVYTINDISSQWTRTVDLKLHVPCLTIREMRKKKGKNEISDREAGINDKKHTTSATYLHTL